MVVTLLSRYSVNELPKKNGSAIEPLREQWLIRMVCFNLIIVLYCY